MTEAYKKLLKCSEFVKTRIDFKPEIGVVLGSGLGNYAKNMDVKAELLYSEIEGFPVSTVEGHDGRFLFGYVGHVPTVLMKGRVHFYEGYDMEEVVLPIRLMGLLGIETLVLTNAAGGINEAFQPGDLMLITDHISSFVKSPLIGSNLDELGVRFPDMSRVYAKGLCEQLRAASISSGVPLQEGVYVQCSGPNYETPAEIRMLRGFGADAVGMSTVCEAMAAVHMGIRVCGISCITNMASGILEQPLDHKEVQETADQVADKFEALIGTFIRSWKRGM